MIIAIAGGDLRSLVVGKLLTADGYICRCYGFDLYSEDISGAELCGSLRDCIKGADALILPLPCTSGGAFLNAPLSSREILFDEVIIASADTSVVCGGMLPFSDDRYIDYYNREELKIRNAVPTAEGAIALAFEEMPVTLSGSSSLVLGFGRIGRCLSGKLHALGSRVTVALRKEKDAALAEEDGLTAIGFEELSDVLRDADVVFNTVPSTVLKRHELSAMREGVPIIDLASRPGGVDFEAAKQIGVRVIWALSLPGKVAPITAGEIIYKSVRSILLQRGITP